MKTYIDEERCTDCGKCKTACPKGPPVCSIEENNGKKVCVLNDPSYCLGCRMCVTSVLKICSHLKTDFKKGLRNLSLEIRIILVEPMYQGNVGSVARAMKNFGYTDLVLVNPCKLEGEAKAMSSHARDVLEGARITSTLDEAVKGANLRIGTTGVTSLKTGEHIRLPLYTSRELKEKLKDYSGTIAILFGREDSGFRNDELKNCDMLITVPTSEIYPIMNLSHAVAVVLYELSDLEGGNNPLADGFDLQLLYGHLEELLEKIDYPPHKKDKTFLMLRRIFGRAGLTPREVQTLRGIIRKTERKMGYVLKESEAQETEASESMEKFI